MRRPVRVTPRRGNVAAVHEKESELSLIAEQVNQVAVQLQELNRRINTVVEVLKVVNANIVAKGRGVG